ncbi:MAG: hypothetical protein IPN59_14020 [Holophaga sp.]|nr:hypothetical protein [Holophaga sp.]
MDQHKQRIDLNGIRAQGGAYALSLSPAQVTGLALGSRLDQNALNELLRKKRGTTRSFELDVRDLAKAGWVSFILPIWTPGSFRPARTLWQRQLRHRREAAGPPLQSFLWPKWVYPRRIQT